jgi:hypothetical protein
MIVLCDQIVMPRAIRDGAFYEFNRPEGHYEVGREIPAKIAQQDVRINRDVYTARASDAKTLAKKIGRLSPTWHPAHGPLYFPHYHPEGDEYGHIFYGTRGEDYERY